MPKRWDVIVVGGGHNSLVAAAYLAKGYSGGSVHNAFTPLKAILRRARRAGLIAVNPSADLPLPTSRARDRAASVREAVELLAPLPGPVVQGIYATAFFALEEPSSSSAAMRPGAPMMPPPGCVADPHIHRSLIGVR